jgi:hypothetical protein
MLSGFWQSVTKHNLTGCGSEGIATVWEFDDRPGQMPCHSGE